MIPSTFWSPCAHKQGQDGDRGVCCVGLLRNQVLFAGGEISLQGIASEGLRQEMQKR